MAEARTVKRILEALVCSKEGAASLSLAKEPSRD